MFHKQENEIGNVKTLLKLINWGYRKKHVHIKKHVLTTINWGYRKKHVHIKKHVLTTNRNH